jgi:hypothetical protein
MNFSSFLFARPSFVEGVARIMDFGNTLNQYNHCESAAMADLAAIAADWSVVGLELDQAAAHCIGPSWEAGRGKRKTTKSKDQLDGATDAR